MKKVSWNISLTFLPQHVAILTKYAWESKVFENFLPFFFPPSFLKFWKQPRFFLDLNYILAITNLDIIYWDLLGWYWPNKINMIWKHFKNWKQCVLRVHQQMLYKTKAHGFSRFDILTYCIPLEFSLFVCKSHRLYIYVDLKILS